MALPRRAMLLNAAVALALLGAGVASALQRRAGERARNDAERHRPIESDGYGYVSSNECRSCHPTQYATWHDSYHRTMTRPATPEYVHGDFAGVELRDGPYHMRVSREQDRFYVETLQPRAPVAAASAPAKQPLALVTGSHHMQVYWYETGEGRKLGQLPFVYLKTEQRWIPRRSAFMRPPHEGHVDEGGRWNTSCIACHSTHGRPRIDAQGKLDTRVAELGIACEACHGPAYQHVRDNASPLSRYRAHLTTSDDDERIVNPRELDHERGSQICSQCHGIWLFRDRGQERLWAERGFSYRPGRDPNETMFLLRPSQREKDPKTAQIMARAPDYVLGQFWPDGMARVSGREFNGMVDSPCYERGQLSCMSCHSMHRQPGDTRPVQDWANDQLALGMDGDKACTQCHGELQGAAASAHTRHAAGSPGSRCYNCHMPYTSFGLLKAMRSHQVSSPNATSTFASGRPNACNLCHLDRSLGWTADALARLWKVPAPELDDDRRTLAASVLGSLRGDAGERALWASAFGWDAAQRASGTHWLEPFLGVLLDDPYDAVRSIAARSLRTLPGRRDFAYDSVARPSSRAPIAPQLARARTTAALPGAVPLRPDGGTREDVVARLLSQRDQRPIDLLE
jgi:hypothetical protein